MTWPFADLDLARRLERAEAEGGARFVESRAALAPEVGAAWIDVGGTYAMFDGAESPITQTFGLGMSSDAGDEQFAQLESFFRDRSAPVQHEVSPLAAPATLARLPERGYQPFEYTSVLYRPVERDATFGHRPVPGLRVRMASPDEGERWAAVGAEGWGDTPELAAFMRDLGRVMAGRRDILLYFAELDGEPIATGALSLAGDVALLAGASTVPRARGTGAQNALLDARLHAAQNRRCTVAMIVALPGSASQRNAERNGFRVAYTRIKWRLPDAR